MNRMDKQSLLTNSILEAYISFAARYVQDVMRQMSRGHERVLKDVEIQ